MSRTIEIEVFESMFTGDGRMVLRKDYPGLSEADKAGLFREGETELTLISASGLRRVLPSLGTQEADAFATFVDSLKTSAARL